MGEINRYNLDMKYIYVCGPTVYSDVHIGNMRPIMTFDIYNRSLKETNQKFTFIHNITDIDDKIIQRAKQENVSEKQISLKYEKYYLQLLKDANINTPDLLPRVTDNIKGIISYIKKIIDNKHAYESEGNVYFDVKSINNYGSLSNNNINTMRFEELGDKKHPGDFALWKKTSDGITFNSPWGKGRPGWHTECAFFISEFANGDLDIHGGGIDLLFPHHENENAQNIAVYQKQIAKNWNHVGHINLENEKMSKSLGNVILAKDFFKKYSPDVLRYIFLTTSISAPINLNNTLINQSLEQINKLKKSFAQTQLFNIKKYDASQEANLIIKWKFAAFNKELNKALKLFNAEGNLKNASKLFSLLKLVGFSFTKIRLSENDKQIYNQWIELRKNKHFDKADKLRDFLIRKKYFVERTNYGKINLWEAFDTRCIEIRHQN